MDRRLKRLQACVLGAVLAFAAQGYAQIVDIAPAIVSKAGELTEQEKAEVQRYVAENSKNLTSPDGLLMRKDRNALLQKLEGGNIGVPFRLAYDTALQEHLNAMLGSPEKKTVINGLVLAGALATDRSLVLILGKLNAEVPDIRYEAARQLARVFEEMNNNQPAVNQVSAAVQAIQQAMVAEADALVRDALIRAALAAEKITTVTNVRPVAISAVSKGLAAVVRKAGNKPPTDQELDALLRGGVGLRDLATRAVQRNDRLPAQAVKDAAEAAGLMLVYVSKVTKSAPNPGAVVERERLAQLAASAQTTIELAGQLLNNQPVNLGVPPLGETIRKGDVRNDAQFGVDVDRVIGVLVKPPFEVAPDKLK